MFKKVFDKKIIVEVKRSDVGYIIDIFNSKTKQLIDTITVWDDDLE